VAGSLVTGSLDAGVSVSTGVLAAGSLVAGAALSAGTLLSGVDDAGGASDPGGVGGGVLPAAAPALTTPVAMVRHPAASRLATARR
jgi:hypothetical protein